MRAGWLLMFLIGFGCAGSEQPRSSVSATSSANACPSGRVSSERYGATEGRCLSPSAGWTRIGEVLSAAAIAVRMSRP